VDCGFVLPVRYGCAIGQACRQTSFTLLQSSEHWLFWLVVELSIDVELAAWAMVQLFRHVPAWVSQLRLHDSADCVLFCDWVV
jgi:hypothetical protein